MTIGVPVCHDTETCGLVMARLTQQKSAAEVIVALDEDGMACGWALVAALAAEPAERAVSEILNEDIPQVPPDIPAEAAAQMMRDRGVAHLFLMHDWPGEPRPSAVIALHAIEARLEAG
jgi:hypothetical protein